jgi:Zn-dependent protease with chaperone function
MQTDAIHFADIAPRAWEHPADRAALEALRAVPGFDRVVAATLGRLNEWTMRKRMLGGEAVEVTPDSHPRLWGVYQDVLWAFDAEETFPLWARPMGGLNAAAVGMDAPFIVIAAEAEDELDEDDVRVVLAHEVAHILSGHVLYKTMLKTALAIGWSALAVPASIPVVVGVTLALMEWDRKSELSADRASALAVGGAGPVLATLRKVDDDHQSVWGKPTPLPPALDAAVKSAVKGVGRAFSRHPPVQVRMDALREWAGSDDWGRIHDGLYARRSDTRVVELTVPDQPMVSLWAGLGEATAPLARLFKKPGPNEEPPTSR